jgi:polyferredoxin
MFKYFYILRSLLPEEYGLFQILTFRPTALLARVVFKMMVSAKRWWNDAKCPQSSIITLIFNTLLPKGQRMKPWKLQKAIRFQKQGST